MSGVIVLNDDLFEFRIVAAGVTPAESRAATSAARTAASVRPSRRLLQARSHIQSDRAGCSGVVNLKETLPEVDERYYPMLTPAPITIVALGDSTTAGTPGFRSPIEAPPSGAGDAESQYAYWLMKTHAEWNVQNRGVNGERSDEIRARFERDVVRARPAIVIIIAGVNDIYQGRSAAVVQRELEAMYDAARTEGIAVVAGSIIPYNTATPDQNARMRAVNDWIRAFAARHPEVVFCDTRVAVAQPGQSDRLVSSPDGLHPSPEGYRLMALALEPAVKAALRVKSGV